jgi:hypothetical protein
MLVEDPRKGAAVVAGAGDAGVVEDAVAATAAPAKAECRRR